jgi:hypothetical protein
MSAHDDFVAALWREAHNGFHLAHTREKQLQAKMIVDDPDVLARTILPPVGMSPVEVQILEQVSKPKRSLPKKKKPNPVQPKDKLLFDAGRYATGARDSAALHAFEILSKEIRENNS